jgi:capsular polysaccharide biosynthesis protein
MDLLALFTTLWRHKVIVLVIMLITGGGAAFIVFGIPPQYESQAQYVLVAPPAVPTDTEIQRDPSLGRVNTNNPYLRLPNPSVVVDILAQRVSGEAVHDKLVSEGADPNYQVTSTNAIGSGLVISITGTGHSPAEASRTLALVSARTKDELHQMQTVNGANEKYLFQALPINPPTNPIRKVTGTVRSLVAVGAAGVVLLFAWISLAEAIAPWRRRRARPAAGPAVSADSTQRLDLSELRSVPGVGRVDDSEATMVLPRSYAKEAQDSRTNGVARD